MSSKKGDILLLLAAAIGGVGFVSMKYLLEWEFTPVQIIAGRFLVAVVCMNLLYWKECKKISHGEWKAGGILGSLLFLLFTLMTVGLKYTTPSVNAFLTNTPAVMVPFISWFLLHKKPDKFCFMGAALTFLGVALLSVTDDFSINIGAVLSLGAAFAFALQMAIMGEYVQKFNPVRLALVENMTVLVLATGVAVLGEPLPAMSKGAVGNFLVLGVFCTAAYFVLQSVGQQYTTASKTAIIITSESVFAALTAAVVYGERLTARGYLGCVILFAAMILAERKPTLSKRKNDS